MPVRKVHASDNIIKGIADQVHGSLHERRIVRDSLVTAILPAFVTRCARRFKGFPRMQVRMWSTFYTIATAMGLDC